MGEKDAKVFSRELNFKDSGETLRVSIEFENVSPEKIKMTKSFIDNLWSELLESIFIF